MSPADNLLKIQTLLLVSGKPVKIKEIASLLKIKEPEVRAGIDKLQQDFNRAESGWWIVENNDAVELASNPRQAEFIEDYLKLEQMAELTRPALETLTIISYCGPVAKTTLDRIRGVNCALILRNLLIKGLVEEVTIDSAKHYQVTMEFMNHLGLSEISQLPNYDKLHEHEYIKEFARADNSLEEEGE